MKVYRTLEDAGRNPDTCATVGAFDGLHVGHVKIIETLVRERQKLGRHARSLLVTFDPHPQFILNPARADFRLLTPLAEKLELLEGRGLDGVLVLPFTRDLADRDAEFFVRDILVKKVGLAFLAVGTGHHFGKDRTGTPALLENLGRELDFRIRSVGHETVDGRPVSSTRIRQLLLKGGAEEAGRLLGRPYRISGRVMRGRRIGTALGYPTANVEVSDARKLVPGDGVYAVQALFEGRRWDGMGYIGSAPTVGNGDRRIEIHLFGLKGELYDHPMVIEWIGRIRDEIRFPSPKAMLERISKDKQEALRLINAYHGGMNGIDEGKNSRAD
ncbi:riboflavin biosynthesis protein RibF [bacterium]|nr:riboflavin biosynthesis protein RibF [bacterium]